MSFLGWGGYNNGEIPHKELTEVANFLVLPGQYAAVGYGSNLMRRDAARQLSGLQNAFYKEFKEKLNVREGYRPVIPVQDFYYKRFVNKDEGWTLAAFPGTSTHGWGLSADLGVGVTNRDFNAAEMAWMRENAPKYGFINDVISEVWHWTFRGTPTITVPQMISNPQTGATKPPTPVIYLKGYDMQNVEAEHGVVLYLADGSHYQYRDRTVSGQRFSGSDQKKLIDRMITAQRNGVTEKFNDLQHDVVQLVFASCKK